MTFINKHPDIWDLKKYHSLLALSELTRLELKELNELEKYSHEQKDTKIRLIVQGYKIQILKKLKTDLNERLTGKREPEEIVKKENKILRWVKNTSFGSLFISGLCLDGIGNFMSTQNLIKGLLLAIAVPIITPVVLTTAFLFTAVNSLLFLSSEVNSLKTAMGIDNRSDIKKCLDLDVEEKKHISTVQNLLKETAKNEDKDQLIHYNTINENCNESISLKKKFYTSSIDKKNRIQTIRNYVCIFVGSVTTVAGSYFWSMALISFFSTFCFLSNPVGWVITGVSIITALAFFLSKGLTKMVAPEIEQYEKLQDEMKNWKEESELTSDFILKKINLQKEEESFRLQREAEESCERAELNAEMYWDMRKIYSTAHST